MATTTDADATYRALVQDLAACFATVCEQGWRIHAWATVEACSKCAARLAVHYVRAHPTQRTAVSATLHGLIDLALSETGPRRDDPDAGAAADDDGTVPATRH